MKRLLLLIIVIIGSVWLGLQMQRDSGYVLIAYRHWTVEMSMWIALAGIVITFIVLYTIVKLLSKVIRLSSSIRHWQKRHRALAAHRLTKRGLLALAEGQWHKAEKHLIRSAKHSDMSLINYLAAAKAALEQGNETKRDHYLQEALASNPESQTAISLTQAQLQIDKQQWKQALATLTSLLKQAPDNSFAYKLLKQVYFQLNDWDNLIELLPQLHKYHLLPMSELNELELCVYCHKLQEASKLNLAQLHAIWRKIPRQLRNNISLVQCYSQLLIDLKQMDEAVILLQEAIKQQWESNLVRLYGLAPSSTPDKQLRVAERWLAEHPNDPELLLCLGRLSIYNQLWGKARNYLEASLAEQSKPETYGELAKLLEKIDFKEEALKYYREGLLQWVYKVRIKPFSGGDNS